jgi:pimeloyl-ACP methyl ester carboxylesterase
MAHFTKSIELPKQVKLPFVEQGDSSGVPVLLLHGFAGSWRAFEPERFASDLMAFIKYNIRLESSVA